MYVLVCVCVVYHVVCIWLYVRPFMSSAYQCMCGDNNICVYVPVCVFVCAPTPLNSAVCVCCVCWRGWYLYDLPYAYQCVCICTYACVCVFCPYVCMCLCVYVCMCSARMQSMMLCVQICVHLCVYESVCVSLCVWLYVYDYVFVCV